MDESRYILDDYKYIGQIPNLPDVPTIVLTYMKIDSIGDTEMRQKWYNAYEQVGKGLSYFKHVTTANSGYFV